MYIDAPHVISAEENLRSFVADEIIFDAVSSKFSRQVQNQIGTPLSALGYRRLWSESLSTLNNIIE